MNSLHQNLFVRVDKTLDYIPILSTASNVVNLFIKTVFIFSNQNIKVGSYFEYLNKKSIKKCLLLLLPVIGNILVICLPFFRSAEQLASPSHNAPPSPHSQPPLVRILPPYESDDQPSLRSSFASSKFSKALGRNSFKISFDWREHPQLADLDTYVIPLLSSLNKRNNEISDNPHIPNIEKDSFIEFLRKLYIEGSCKGKLGFSLSVDNIQELKKAVAVILNHLDSSRGEENFQKLYADVVHDVWDALEHCSNRINPEIDRIILDLKAKGGSLGEKIALFLQKQRIALLRQVIHEAVASSQPRYVSMWGMVKNAHFFLEHEAASTNFYFRELSDQLGIVSHLSKTDFAHLDHVCKGLENEILSRFRQAYNGEKILDWVAEAILDPYNSSIPTRLFTKWVETHDLDDEDICIDPSTGHYKKGLIAFMLRELEILS